MFGQRERGSLVVGEKRREGREGEGGVSQREEKINNPLHSLWIWISLNVLSQVFNLVYSVVLVASEPPDCLIVKDNYTASNILELIFLFLTMYLCFGSTLFYVLRKATPHRQPTTKSAFLSKEAEAIPNIELNPQTNSKSNSSSVS